MKILVATMHTQGMRDDDFSRPVSGELVSDGGPCSGVRSTRANRRVLSAAVAPPHGPDSRGFHRMRASFEHTYETGMIVL